MRKLIPVSPVASFPCQSRTVLPEGAMIDGHWIVEPAHGAGAVRSDHGSWLVANRTQQQSWLKRGSGLQATNVRTDWHRTLQEIGHVSVVCHRVDGFGDWLERI